MTVPAVAQTGVDPNLYVCTGCTVPPSGSSADPVTIDPNSFNVGNGGSNTFTSPVLLIVGVPNGGPAPTLVLPNGVFFATGQTYYGLPSATSGTGAGTQEGILTSTSGSPAGDVYSSAGLTTGSPSESFTNWTQNPFPANGSQMGATNPDAGVTSFNLYAYAISYNLGTASNPDPLKGLDLTNVTVGSYVIAYVCDTLSTMTACANGSGLGSTPFTTAGFVATPLPGALALFGSVLVGGLGVSGWRKRRGRGAVSLMAS
jgi:hypothetical protein